MLVAILCAGFTSAWANEVEAYTLTPASGSNNGYANNCDITISTITWNLTGNSTIQPWRIGGKSLSGVDRTLYSKTAIADNVSKIEVTHGAASSITVNSWTVIVASDADFTNVVNTLNPTFEANKTTTITRPDGKDWSNCYYKFVYNVTVSGSSNKYIEFSKATFYKESGSSDPIQLSAPELAATANNGSVTLEWNAIDNASSYTIQYADNASFTGATTVTDATSPQEISGLTNGTTYYFKAMTVGDNTNYLSSNYGDAVSATPANVAKITITQDNLTDFTNTYAWYDWTAGGVSGSAYAYKNSGMQFNSSKEGYWIYNTSAIPGTITSVKMVKASGTDRSWTLKAGTSEISSTDDGTQIGEAQTVGTSGATWNVNGSYNYFCLIVSGGSTVIQSIEITYIPSTDPIIVASDPSDLAYDATEGEFGYSITNSTSATLSATSNAAWITNVTVDGTNSKVTFNTSTNEATTQRQGTITLSYTGATDKVVTITQAGAPVQHQDYNLTVTLNDNVSAIFVYNADDQSNPLIADGAAGTVQVTDDTQVLVSPDVASGYVLGSLTVDGVDVTSQMDAGSYTFTMPTHAVTITATAVVAPVVTNYTLASTITSGKHYIIVNNEAGRAMGEQASNNRQAGGVTISGQTASVASNATVVEFVIYGPDVEGYYTIYDAAYNNNEGGYLYAASGSSNHLKTQTTNDNNGRWSINIDNDGVASIVAQGTNTRNVMQYNPNNGNPIFACYASDKPQKPVYLYEKDGEAKPTESKTLNKYGYATYASQNALDFTNASDFSAWTITGINGTEIIFSQIEGSARAGTGLFLMGEADGSVIMTSATGASALTGNLLEGIIADKTIAEDEYFGLKGNEFRPVNAGTVPAGKALLPANVIPASSGAKAFTFRFIDPTTGIAETKTVSAEEAAAIFNLAGQRLQKMQKGINIVNGQKVLVK